MRSHRIYPARLRVALAASTAALALSVAPALAGSPATPESPHDHGTGSAYGEELGTVVLPASCTEAATPHLRRGLALLHHMTYEGAHEAFAVAAGSDPDCALAYWGQAMTFIHPLWSDPPTEEGFARGRSLVEKAAALPGLGAREEAYLSAAEAYYAAGRDSTERPNLEAFADAWKRVHERFPEDPEAACFHALSHLATADPGDKSYAKQRHAGALAEAVLAKIPDHPGGHHYAIHAYDYPALAPEALAVARSYGDIAPAVPHALHMPTHIFTRLGLWDESIAWNHRSARVAHEHPVNGAVSLHHLHAVDYLVYAHLQRAEDAEAERVAAAMAALEGPLQVEVAAPYTLAAVPARLALERQRWAEAAALEPRTPADFPWDRFPAMEAITHFARALGAARSGNPEAAKPDLEALARLRDRAAESSAYWAEQVEIQRLTASAWVAFAEGRKDEALATMKTAAEREAATEKHPVTPGEVLPAHELLGDMLLEMGRSEEALATYEAALERSPGRFNALYGAGRAAEVAGDEAAARRHFQALLDGVGEEAAERERLAHARAFVAGGAEGGG